MALSKIKSTSLETDATNFVLLSTQVASSGTSSVNWDNTLLTSTYKTYQLYGYSILVSTDQTNTRLKFSADNGSSFLTGHAGRHYTHTEDSAVHGAEISTATQNTRLNTNLGNDADQGGSLCYTFTGLTQTTSHKFVGGWYHGAHYGDDSYIWRSGISYQTTSAINYIRFECDSGTFSGTFVLYGVKE